MDRASNGENKNCVVFPEKIDGQYVILYRPMPRIVCIRVSSLESERPETGLPLVGPRPGSWRSSRVGAGAPPIPTSIGWLLPFHGATAIEHGEVPQVDPANFKTGIRVVFPQELVERGDYLLVYYGASDVSVAAARVRKRDLVASLTEAIN